MLSMTYAAADQALAARLTDDLKKRGESIAPLSTDRQQVLLALLSPASVKDATVEAAIAQALDNGQHVVALQTAAVDKLPKLIDHLTPLDFSTGYPLDTLLQRVEQARSKTAPLPLKVLTPKTRQRNRNWGIWLTILVLGWFIIGLIAVGVFQIQVPQEEYNTVATFEAATVQFILLPNQPRTTQDAVSFPITVTAAPTHQRPLLIGTATALVERLRDQ
jgi:hypothetical protein